jgi:DNA-binding winged helix-turn-helix (wHTH) protein
MDTLSNALARFNRIELAHEPDFPLGHVLVRPSRCEVVVHGTAQTLQRRVMQVLVTLAQAEGEVVSHDDLVMRCWAGLAVSADAIVRCIGKLRRLGADLSLDAFTIETIPGVGYRLTVPASSPGPNIARGGSALVRRAVVARTQKVIVATAVAITLALLSMQLFPSRTSGATRLVRVEPLTAARDDRKAQAISLGLGAALTRNLAGSNTPVEILDAGAHGASPEPMSVRGNAANDHGVLRANVELVASPSGKVVWAGRFERPASELDAFMDQVSVQIAHELHCASSDGWPRYFDRDPELARLALDHCDAIGRDFDEMVRYDAQITQRAPDFARGWSTYAIDTALVAKDLPPRLREAGYARARQYARRALAIDSHQGLAYAAIMQTMDIVPQWFERERVAAEGMAADPHSAEIHSWHGMDLTEIGRLQDALGEARLAYQYEHFLAGKVMQLAITEANAGEIEAARDSLALGRRLWPRHPWFDWVEFELAFYDGDPATAIKLLDERKVRFPESRIRVYSALLAWRMAPSAGTVAAAVRAINSGALEGPVTGEQVQLLALLGHIDAAYQLAGRLPSSTMDNVGWFRKGLKPFRADRRFMALAARFGLAQIWLKSGMWPDFCSEKGFPYDCRTAALAALRTNMATRRNGLSATTARLNATPKLVGYGGIAHGSISGNVNDGG